MARQARQPAKSQGIYPKIRLLLKSFILLISLITLGVVAYSVTRFLPVRTTSYDTMEAHFKYASTGGDLVTGIPVWMWQAMPLICADTLESVAEKRLSPDYRARTQQYSSLPNAAEQRRALSREGYKALGFLYERDSAGKERDLPIGISNSHSLGLDRAYMNCAICHSSTVRTHEDDPATLVLGMPANLFNLYAFEQFMFQCTKNQNFGVLDVIPEIQALGGDLGLIDQYIVYPLAIWLARDGVQFLENIAGFSARQPKWGPGRNDTFTNNKVFLYGEPWRDTMPDYHQTGKVLPNGIGIVDWPSTWLQGLRKKRDDGKPMQLHWDGNNDRVEERNLNASLATSALPTVIDHESIECIEQWLETLEPPAYMSPINQALAEAGKPVYEKYSMNCHGKNRRDFSGNKVGHVTHIDLIGTDRYRLDNYTEELALNMATTYAGQKREQTTHTCPGGAVYQPSEINADTQTNDRLAAIEAEESSYRYKHYRKTNGYANMPLDGIWLRAPYLHNGSVPTLRDLLEPADLRPEIFYRGNNIYDAQNVGFVSNAASDAEGRPFFKYDTSIPGNDNVGHEGAGYGTLLSKDKKDALLEYLKTF